MRNRIPAEAFDYYRDLGPGRSYVLVARKFGVSVRGVTKRAVKEGWQARLLRIAAEAAAKSDEKAVGEAAAVNDRHLRVIRAIQHKALAALQSLPLNSGMDAVRALDMSVKAERLVLGTDDDRQQPAVIQVITGVSPPTHPENRVLPN